MGNVSGDIPASLVAGDSASWTRSLMGYKASDGWALTYTLVGATAVYSFAAVADGDNFKASVAATDTVGWAPGVYSLQEFVTKASDRHTIGIRRFAIGANLAVTATAGADVRSHAQKVLDAINAWLESRAPVAGALEVNGRRIQYYPLADLLALRDRYRREVALEMPGGVRRGRPVYVSL